MNDKINELLERVEAFKPKAAAEIEDFRIRMLGKKGELTALMEEFKSVAPELKREFGQKLNNLKNRTQERINALRGQLADAAGDSSQRIPDMSRPGSAEELGSRHPISLVTNQIVEVFSRLGYTVAEGPEIEDDWHVFSRSTSARASGPRHAGYVLYRQEPRRATADPHLVDSGADDGAAEAADPGDLPGPRFPQRSDFLPRTLHLPPDRGTLYRRGRVVRRSETVDPLLRQGGFRRERHDPHAPSYFPFTEPSAEVDVSCNLCGGKGCNVCKGTGWLEIMGCGMVDPNVLEANGIDSKKYSGFAFGMGVERIAMLKYGVKDLRLYFENDVRFLHQFDTVL